MKGLDMFIIRADAVQVSTTGDIPVPSDPMWRFFSDDHDDDEDVETDLDDDDEIVVEDDDEDDDADDMEEIE